MLALTVAPAPDGYLKKSALAFLNPYLNLLFLQNDWGFFSPVGLSQQFRVVIKDSTGKEHRFSPTQQVNWYDASALWRKDWFRTVSGEPEKFANASAATFCKTHAILKPKTVVLMRIQQNKEFLPTDYLDGKNPFDPEFSSTEEIKKFQC